jgi:acetolactate synthase-1/2/3 large subunit
MRVCDYIANKLNQLGVKQVYGLVGGGTSGLNDGFICHPDIEFVCFHHEQGAGHAAVGAARTNQNLSVVNVTTGCGGTNVLTSCLNAWQESVPVLFLSGNTKITNMAAWINQQKGIELRRYGLQEHNITETVKNLTKYAVLITSVDDVAYELDKAIDIATTGRPGPVWIDVPGNIQTAQMPDSYKKYISVDNSASVPVNVMKQAFNDLILPAVRPLIVAGAGISMSQSENLFLEFAEKYNIPFVTTFRTRDLVESEHYLNVGMIGIKGNRAANFAMQNADLLLILGSSMNVSHIGYDDKTFSPHSKKIMVDIDSSELKKDIITVDAPIKANVRDFLNICLPLGGHIASDEWLNKILHWRKMWPTYDPLIHRPDESGINLYEIVESMNRNMMPGDVVITDAGQPCYICSTNLKFRKNQRYMGQAAQGDMGYAIPAMVGVYKTNPDLNVISCIGEGSFYTNMQELAVIKQHNIPAKILVINNDGYLSIKQTQTKFFDGRLYGVSNSTGIYFANIAKVADSFEIEYIKINNNQELDELMPKILSRKNAVIVEIMSQDTMDVLPAQAIKPDGTQGGLHDMAPFLTQEELAAEMIVKI